LDSTKRRKKHTSQQKGNQKLLYESIQSFNHSRLGEFVYSSTARRNHPNEKCRSRTAAFPSTRVFLDRRVQNLNEHVQRCFAKLEFNLDEVCISHWEDRKTRTVIEPSTMRGQTIHHGISRIVNHISVIVCVSAAEESLTPSIITSQDLASVREQLKKHSVRFGADFVLKSNTTLYINPIIFLDYIRAVFLLNLAELRTSDDFAEEIGVLQSCIKLPAGMKLPAHLKI
jgi:hypothetical protein